MSRLLDRVGEEVRGEPRRDSSDLRRARQRARLVAASETRARKGNRRRVALGAGVALAAAAALALVWQTWRQPSPIMCRNGSGNPVAVHSWIDVVDEKPETLVFSDESRVAIRPDSRARLTRIDTSTVTMSLENGALHASIVSAPERSWEFVAGPYRVVVTGTILGVAWAPDARRLVVEVERGSVEVTGDGLDERTVEVVAGEQLVVSRDADEKPSVQLSAVDSTESDPGPAAIEDSLEEAPPTAFDDEVFDTTEPLEATGAGDPITPGEVSTPQARPARVAVRENVRRLHHHLRARQRREAVHAAERVGVAAAAESLSAARIAQLAEYLRLEGRPDEAERILRRLRGRYPSHAEARRAAFVLGRLALDHTRYDDARRWFRTVLREAPRSSFAEEAFGRLIDTEVRAGHAAAARSAAEEYLTRYPRGSYRRVAEQLVSQPLTE